MLLENVVDLDHGYTCVLYLESIVCKFRHNCNVKYFQSTSIKIASNYLGSTIVVGFRNRIHIKTLPYKSQIQEHCDCIAFLFCHGVKINHSDYF